jgi:hypothetical protein
VKVVEGVFVRFRAFASWQTRGLPVAVAVSSEAEHWPKRSATMSATSISNDELPVTIALLCLDGR